jgi:2-C-methyl-D-erythritol 2,4-cyclodiphosphate synthase
MSLRIGNGYDVHAFDDGGQGINKIVIGGVMIPHTHGLMAHSDGDVLLHALCDALLGAVALGDIGQHFPDTDIHYQNIDSRALLRIVYAKVQNVGFNVVNADMTIVAQAPKMSSYISGMCLHVADDLKVDVDAINIKATTTEHLGFTGRKEGIAAYAVVLLKSALESTRATNQSA